MMLLLLSQKMEMCWKTSFNHGLRAFVIYSNVCMIPKAGFDSLRELAHCKRALIYTRLSGHQYLRASRIRYVLFSVLISVLKHDYMRWLEECCLAE